jgi:hypothetical protein
MATSPAHKLGQIIGDCLEAAIEPVLQKFAKEHGLYLDKKGPRQARRGKKLTWTDINGNQHDLDFVLEKNGTEQKIGAPIAFIECAWRRYTKHSRNKAQEIQGAIKPLVEKYQEESPFKGVVLAGEFTEPAIKQLESLGFSVLHISYENIVKAFQKAKVDVFFDEKTSEADFAERVSAWESKPEKVKSLVCQAIRALNRKGIQTFIDSLTPIVERKIASVRVWTMFGQAFTFPSIQSAQEFIHQARPNSDKTSFQGYVVEIEYSNKDSIKVEGKFKDKQDALSFLSRFSNML